MFAAVIFTQNMFRFPTKHLTICVENKHVKMLFMNPCKNINKRLLCCFLFSLRSAHSLSFWISSRPTLATWVVSQGKNNNKQKVLHEEVHHLPRHLEIFQLFGALKTCFLLENCRNFSRTWARDRHCLDKWRLFREIVYDPRPSSNWLLYLKLTNSWGNKTVD